MLSVARIGKPMFLLAVLLFAIGGVTAWNGGDRIESVLYVLLAVLLAALSVLLALDRAFEQASRGTARHSPPIDLRRWK